MTKDGRNTVSVIICCYTEERREDIREAIASVQAQTRPPEEIILVVDNNLPLYQKMRAELQDTVYVVSHEGIRGSSAARNTGAEKARGDIVAFIDDDAVVDPQWIQVILSDIQGGAVVAGGKATLLFEAGRPIWFPETLDWLAGGTITAHATNSMVVRNVQMHNMAVIRSVFLEAGMLKTGGVGTGGMVGTRFCGGEENDLCVRIASQFPSGTILFDPEAKISHKVESWKTRWRTLIARSFGEGISKAWLANESRGRGISPLSTEKRYLSYLLLHAIPFRLLRFWRLAGLAQSLAIVACIAAVGTGLLWGRWKLSLQKANRVTSRSDER